jgi:hypothetical protein
MINVTSETALEAALEDRGREATASSLEEEVHSWRSSESSLPNNVGRKDGT